MNAVIMAGGEGKGLRPLTCNLPQTMVRLCGKPVISYLMDLLIEHGYQRSVIALRYLPEVVEDYFHTRRYRGLQIDFFREDAPLGTAGSVKLAARKLELSEKDPLLVMGGDSICDFDLGQAVKFHRQAGADLTIIGKSVENPCEYELIDREETGRVRGLLEKPSFAQAVTDIANTGVYLVNPQCLELIPEGREYDFEKDLFPQMLALEKNIMVWEDTGYWCKIEEINDFVRCQQDILLGRVNCRLDGERDEEGNIIARARPVGDYHLTPPCYIGEGVNIADGALVEGLSVLDHGCAVGRNSRITGGILLPESFVGRKSVVAGGIVCDGASVKPRAMVFENAVVGAGAVIGEGAVLHQEAKIWPGKWVEDGAHFSGQLKTGRAHKAYFDDEGIVGHIGVEITPEFCARLGAAAATVEGSGKIAIGVNDSHCAKALAEAMAAGILGAGGQVFDFGECFVPQFNFCCSFSSIKMGFFIQVKEKAVIRMVAEGGIGAPRQLERAVEHCLRNGDFRRTPPEKYAQVVDMSGVSAIYKNELYRFAPYGLMGMQLRLRCENTKIHQMMWEVLQKLGAQQSGQEGIPAVEISPDGERAKVVCGDIVFDRLHLLCVCAAYEMQQGKEISVCFDAPRVLDQVAKRQGKVLRRYYRCPADQSDLEARELAYAQHWTRDPLMLVVKFLSLLHVQRMSPAAAAASVPDFSLEEKSIPWKGTPGALRKELREEKITADGEDFTEGIVIQKPDGIVLLQPSKLGNRIKIMAEAANSETAKELCDGFEKLLNKKKLDMQGEKAYN